MKNMIVLIMILFPALIFAQSASNPRSPYISKGATSFFDPSKLKIHQSYSFGYYSGGGSSGSVGYYLNSIEYAVSNPLKIRVDLGFLHSPSSMLSGRGSLAKSSAFVPGFSLDWRPSPSFNFRIDYHQMPGYYNSGPFYFDPTNGEDYH